MNCAPHVPQPSNKVPHKSLQVLLQGLATVDARHERDIYGISLDSRQVKTNDLFIAVRGQKHDGRNYIHSAVANGAIAVVREKIAAAQPVPVQGDECEEISNVPNFDIVDLKEHIGTIASRFFAHPSTRMRVLGITGTNGKTTCAYLLAQAFTRLGQRCALLSTIGNGLLDSLQPATLTTEDALSTQRRLAALCAKQVDTVCVEVSSHGLQQGRVQQVAFDVALFTNLSHDHLDYHGDMENYGRAKQRLFQFDRLACAVIHVDDPFGRRLLHQHRAARGLSYGIQDGEVRARDIQLNENGIAFAVQYRGQVERIHSPLIGAVNVPNLLASIATLLACGYKLAQIALQVGFWQPPPGRMQRLRKAPSQPTVVIDYAHTPAALENALRSLGEFCKGALWVVFGCGGERDRSKRRAMGALAESLADRVIITDDNPRTENPQHIAAQIVSGMQGKATIMHARRQAIETAILHAAAEDIVLIAGKGHESTQSIGTRVIESNDRDLALAVLQRTSMPDSSAGGGA